MCLHMQTWGFKHGDANVKTLVFVTFDVKELQWDLPLVKELMSHLITLGCSFRKIN